MSQLQSTVAATVNGEDGNESDRTLGIEDSDTGSDESHDDTSNDPDGWPGDIPAESKSDDDQRDVMDMNGGEFADPPPEDEAEEMTEEELATLRPMLNTQRRNHFLRFWETLGRLERDNLKFAGYNDEQLAQKHKMLDLQMLDDGARVVLMEDPNGSLVETGEGCHIDEITGTKYLEHASPTARNRTTCQPVIGKAMRDTYNRLVAERKAEDAEEIAARRRRAIKQRPRETRPFDPLDMYLEPPYEGELEREYTARIEGQIREAEAEHDQDLWNSHGPTQNVPLMSGANGDRAASVETGAAVQAEQENVTPQGGESPSTQVKAEQTTDAHIKEEGNEEGGDEEEGIEERDRKRKRTKSDDGQEDHLDAHQNQPSSSGEKEGVVSTVAPGGDTGNVDKVKEGDGTDVGEGGTAMPGGESPVKTEPMEYF